MEEDIKILEGLVKGIYKYGFDYDVDGEKHDIIRYEEFKALENLIKGYKELEEKVTILDGKEIGYKLAIEELKKENKEYKEYIKKLNELNSRDFIFKSTIKEKIEELNKIILNARDGESDFILHCCTKKQALEELMEDK